MRYSRKTLINVLLDNLVNVFNITTVVLLVFFIINKEYFYLIPLALSLCASIISLVLDIKNYLIRPRIKQRLNVLVNGEEREKSLSRLKMGDEVVLYPKEVVHFVGKVKNGAFLVDEGINTGSTVLVRKAEGASIVKGSIIIEGSGVAEVTELGKRFIKTTFNKDTEQTKRIKLFNLVFSSISLLVVLLTFIFNKDSFNNVLKSAIVAIPCLFNIILTIYLLVLSIKEKKDLKILDYSFLSELKDIDVVCLDKTGTITTGEYEVYKTVVLAPSALNVISIDPARAFEQVVSNVVKTTKEDSGYYSAIQEHFIYDVSKIISESSPIKRNGRYSAITVKGGSTYALGEVDSFEYINAESAMSTISEYQSMGYHVLVLAESKNPLKSGLIEGKTTAIGLIILQETIRESAKELIKYCLENNKQVKVISGDRIATVSEVCRKAGLENHNRATSVKLVPLEKIALLLEEDVVFADATPSQKAFIIKELQKNGHKVAFIGDGDNDVQALKAANVAVSLNHGSESAIKCSQVSIGGSFSLTKEFIDRSRTHKARMDAFMAMTYSQNAFAAFFLLFFMITSFINKSLINPFEAQHLWLWTLLGILIPIILILIKPNVDFKQRSFLRNFITDSVALIFPILVLIVLQLLQFNGVGYFGLSLDKSVTHETLITSGVVNSLAYLSTIITSLFIVYNHLAPFNRYRSIVFASLLVIPAVYAALLGFSVDVISIVTQIETKEITPINYFVMGVITLFCSATYIFVLDIITTVKGENPNVKSKSKC